MLQFITSTLQFAKEYPTEFAALPEAYQSDDCLEYQILDNEISCYPKPGQESVLGYWSCV